MNGLKGNPKMVSINDRTKKCAGIILLVSAIALILGLMLYCNLHTGLMADDYSYSFSFSNGQRITNISQIFDSMRAHRQLVNGRVITHSFVQLFLMIPHVIFDIVNSLVFILEILMVLFCCGAVKKHNWLSMALSVFFAFSCFWLFQPSFGEANLWLDGSINYLWPSVLFLFYLLGFLKLNVAGKISDKTNINIFYILVSIVVGASHEIVGITSVGLFAFTLLRFIVKKMKFNVWMFLSFACNLAGFLFVVSSPGELNIKLMLDFSFENIKFFLWKTMVWIDIANRMLPLVVIYIILFLIAVLMHVRKDILEIAVMLFLLSGIAFFPFLFGAYLVGRNAFLVTDILIVGSIVLLREIAVQKKKGKAIAAVFIAGVFVYMIPVTITGIKDLNASYRFSQNNVETILKAKAEGISVVAIPDISHENVSDISSFCNIGFVGHESIDDWPNTDIAKYYGVENVYYSGVDIEI